MFRFLSFTFPLFLTACFNKNAVKTRPAQHDVPANSSVAFYDFTLNDLEGVPVSFSKYRGKKVVLLNVASRCGYTPQYKDWEAFHRQYGDKVVVLGFPANDFMGQEPGSDKEIAEFCQRNYGVSFQMFGKLHVKGKDKAPLYQWLTDPGQNGWNSQEPTWNFCKYLVDENGRLVSFFASDIRPDNPEFRKALGF